MVSANFIFINVDRKDKKAMVTANLQIIVMRPSYNPQEISHFMQLLYI
jgi:hypothetical protein